MKKNIMIFFGMFLIVVFIVFMIVKSGNQDKKTPSLSYSETSNQAIDGSDTSASVDEGNMIVTDDGTLEVPQECYIVYNKETYEDMQKFLEAKNSNKGSINGNSRTDECMKFRPVYKIEDGEYKKAGIGGTSNSVLSLVDENDVAKVIVNGKNYKLDSKTPSMTLLISDEDDIKVSSKSKSGVLYDSKLTQTKSVDEDGVEAVDSSSQTS